MLLAEDLLTLLVEKSAGEPPRRRETKPVLAAALLMELAVAGRIGADWDGGGRLHLFVEDRTPLGDPELDNAIAVVAGMDGDVLVDVVLALVPGLHVRLVNRLVTRGCLTRRWRLADRSRREYLCTWLSGVLYGLIPVEWGSGALITLLDLAAATTVVTKEPGQLARAREIADGDWPAGETASAIAAKSADVVRYWTTHGPTGFVGSPDRQL